MKNKTFGDVTRYSILNDGKINKERFKQNGVELIVPSDNQSARVVNRPISQLYEDVEDNYLINQFLTKMLFGSKQPGIVPGYLENFNKSGLIVGSYYDKNFLRIPTGMAVISQQAYNLTKDQNQDKENGEEADEFDNYNLTDKNSITIINKPRTELFEREIADYYHIDLDELDNDVKADYECKLDSGSGLYLDYTLSITKSKVDNTVDGKKNIVTTTIDVNNNKKNIFDLVNSLSDLNYVNKNGYYSLEETIPLDSVSSGKYILFYKLTANEENDVIYSVSNKYGIRKIEESLNINIINDYFEQYGQDTFPLFSFKLTVGNGISISEKDYFLDLINRSEINIKNLSIYNDYITVDNTTWKLCDGIEVANMI